MNFDTTITHQSKTCPGVSFTVRRWTAGMRREVRRRLEPIHQRLADIAEERSAWSDQVAAAHGLESAHDLLIKDLTRAERAKFDGFNNADDFVRATQMDPALFDAGFIAIEGLTIDNMVPANAIAVRESAPPELVEEILSAIRAVMGLSPAQIENLELPTTSAAGVAGETIGTTAAPAGESSSISSETADDISQTP